MKYRNPTLMEKIVREEEQRIFRANENWSHLGGNTTKLCKAFYFIAAIYLLLVNAAYIFQIFLNLEDAAIYPDNYDIVQLRSALIVMFSVSAAMIAAFIVMILKKYLLTLIFALPAGIITLIFFLSETEHRRLTLENGTERFVLQHLLPIIVYILAVIIIYIICFKDKKNIFKKYDKAVALICEKYNKEHPHVSNDEWKNYIKQYNVYEDADNIKKKRAEKS